MQDEVEKIKKYVRATNYLTVAQIYLQDNFLLKNKLSFDDIKARLLGHWGTCPGINFVYANLNNLITKTCAKMAFVLGPGHGFPALQANLFLEGTLGKYYTEATKDFTGLSYVAKEFSWPYGFPSHSSPVTPGVILEGGELGYSLSVSYGAVLDNPELIVACLVGDGEAETASLATAWHLNKFIDPATNGAVLPILHLNGYKISGPTIFGRMNNADLKSLFKGYGYEPIIVEGANDKVYEKMIKALDESYTKIKAIQKDARDNKKEGKDKYFARFPMIILKTPKGWTGIKKLKGDKIEGNCLSHQVVGKDAKTDKIELKAIEKWMHSYKFEELFSEEKGFIQRIFENIPKEELRMGDCQHTYGIKKGDNSRDLILPEINDFYEDFLNRGKENIGSMKKIGTYLTEVFKLNKEKKNFRLMSPDETYSNRLQDVFTQTTRAFTGPVMEWDNNMSSDGRVMEMLSENSLQGLAQGYILTGRFAVFASYEAFIPIVSSMADQYSKFLKIARQTEWRGDVPSFNYILTSSGWRQEHNGFSHQNPGFIDGLLQKHNDFISVFFPADANEAVAVMKRCLSSKNEINIIVAEKTIEPIWLKKEEVEKELTDGLSVWNFASDENPDIVIAGCGQYLVKEALATIDLIKKETPEIKVRFVNILELSPGTLGSALSQMPEDKFEKYFTSDKPVIFNFHGYPETLKQSLFDYAGIGPNPSDGQSRFSVHGYLESGSTTTAFDLHIRNKTDRYNLLIETVLKMAKNGVISEDKASKIAEIYQQKIIDHKDYIIKFGADPDEIEKWQWSKN